MASILILLLVLMKLISSALAFIQPRPRSTSCSFSSSPLLAMMSLQPVDTAHPYHPPTWADGHLNNVPRHRLHLANLPTPIHRIGRPKKLDEEVGGGGGTILSRLHELNITLYIKRDDATGGVELGGNKVRKLEFLLADALAKGCDSVVTIGGEQSNHCRATAAASRMVGLYPHLILRTSRADAIQDKKEDLGWTGNILFDRMVGSTIHTCTPREYGQLGSNTLVANVCDYIRTKEKSHQNPYAIPVGGSNGLGTWGYINAVDELMYQIGGGGGISGSDSADSSSDFALDHVVFATGSGGTATGIAVGLSLAFGSLGISHPSMVGKSAPKVHAVGVCDDPEYFYQTMSSIADEMGIELPPSMTTDQFIREAVTVYNGKGRGYAFSSDDELAFILQFAIETGVSLDPVYSGKALYYFLEKIVKDDPEAYQNKNILFWHTGGSIGLYEKGDTLLERMLVTSPVNRVDATTISSSKSSTTT